MKTDTVFSHLNPIQLYREMLFLTPSAPHAAYVNVWEGQKQRIEMWCVTLVNIGPNLIHLWLWTPHPYPLLPWYFFFLAVCTWTPPLRHNLRVKLWFNRKAKIVKLTKSTREGVHTSRGSKMRFGWCSGLITLPHLTCISEAWNLICMQLLFSITVWESWAQGLRSHYPEGRGVLEGGR